MIKDKKTIKDFTDSISVDGPLDIPTPETLLSAEDYGLVKEMFDIVSKYRSPTWITDMSITEMHQDLLRLQSMQVSLMFKMGAIAAAASTSEEQLKIARSKVRINSRNLKQEFEEDGNSVSITLDDIKELSYTKTEDMFSKLEQNRIASEFIKYVYFSIKDHIFMLNNTVQRISKYE